jgi:hypothetical protein
MIMFLSPKRQAAGKTAPVKTPKPVKTATAVGNSSNAPASPPAAED